MKPNQVEQMGHCCTLTKHLRPQHVPADSDCLDLMLGPGQCDPFETSMN